MNTDPIKQDELDEIFHKVIGSDYMTQDDNYKEAYAHMNDLRADQRDKIPKAKTAILANYIPKQALAAALEEPDTWEDDDSTSALFEDGRDSLRAELRQQFGLEPKGES